MRLRTFVVLALFCILSATLIAQAPGTGLYSFGSFDNRGFDSINAGNLNTHFEIPIVNKPGRGQAFNYSLVYDGLIWAPTGSSGNQSWVPDSGWGFHGQLNGATNQAYVGYLSYSQGQKKCFLDPPSWYWAVTTSNYVYYDAFGQQHGFNYATDECTGTTTGDGKSWDGSGYRFDGAFVDTRDGKTIVAPYIGTSTASSITDSNGNVIKNNGDGTFTDTLGLTALSITGGGTPGSPRIFTYKVANQSDGSNTASVTVSYVGYTVQTNFGCTDSGSNAIAQFGPLAINLVDQVILADGTFYKFNYEATPGVSGAVTGRLASITLPTGGTISYQFSGGCNGSGMNADGTIANLTRTTSDGSRSYSRATVNANATSTTLQDENGNQTTYAFTNVGGLFYETHHTVWAGNASANQNLSDVYTCYNGTPANCDGVAITPPIIQVTAISSHNAGVQSSVTDNYDASSGLLTSEQVYDYGGARLQTMNYAYVSPGRVSSVTVSDGSQNIISQATYGYDEQTPTATSNLPQHNAASGPRGNQTSANFWVNTTNSTIGTKTTYDDAGQVLSTTDARGNTTTYSYETTDTFVTKVSYPAPGNGNNTTISTGAQYDANSGILLSTTDANNQTTTYRTHDRLLRPTEIDFPDGGQTTSSFSDVNTYWTNQNMGNGVTSHYVTHRDGYGRQDRIALYNGQQNAATDWNQVDYCYDAVGNLSFQTTPYTSSGFNVSKQCSGSGTTFGHDALGRQTSATLPDGNVQSWLYNSNTATNKDEVGNQWQYTMDGLGRTTKVIEPNSAETDYTFSVDPNTHNQLVTVSQKGTNSETPRPGRVFTSDSLGRTVSTNEPERGTTNYGYDNNGNMISTTDARGVATTNTYDALNRLTWIHYSDGTQTQAFGYDGNTENGNPLPWTVTNAVGRLSIVSNQINVASSYSYDPMGRLIQQRSCLPSDCSYNTQLQMGYDLAGNMTSLRYPDGRVITQGFGAGGNLQNVTFDNWNGQHVGYNYASGFTYTPAGTQTEVTYGNGVYIHTPYNSRQQMCQVWSQKSDQVLIDTHIYYGGSTTFCNNTLGNNGNITQIKDWRNPAHTRYFGYDPLNRLSSFSNAADPNSSDYMTQSYSYDSFGNLSVSGSGNNSTVGYDANNRINTGGFGYDAAGNLTQANVGGNTTYAFDGAGQLSNISSGSGSVRYTHDGDGNRVRKDLNDGSYREYVYLGGQVIAEKNADGAWSDYIYANGQRIARADGYDIRIHMNGTNCANCGDNPNMFAGVTSLTAANGYTIRQGDVLTWRQYQDGSTTGGLLIWLKDSNGHGFDGSSLLDKDGLPMDQDTTMNSWHIRSVDLSPYAGDTIQLIDPFQWTSAPAGNWDIYYGDISLVSTDGSVIPIYSRTTATLSTATNPTVGNFSAITEKVPDTNPLSTTTYYTGDQIGSTRMITVGGGWPVSTSTFYPFGQEQAATAGPDHYKFAGLERDEQNGETGLDHATFRQLSPIQGRWLSPDFYMGSYDFYNPQSFNRYAYVMNNPLLLTDPSGLESNCTSEDDGGQYAGCWSYAPPASGGGGTGGAGTGGAGTGGAGGLGDRSCWTYCPGDGAGAATSSWVFHQEFGLVGGSRIAPSNTVSKTVCFTPNALQRLEISAQSAIARRTGKTIGFGVAGSVAAGLVGVGVSVNGSAQLMVQPNGRAALVYSISFPSTGFLSTRPGQGENLGFAANIGITGSVSTQPIGVSGANWSVDGSYGPVGAGINSSGGSLTFGGGVGAKASGGVNVNLTKVVPTC